MKFFMLEVSIAEPKQYRITAITGIAGLPWLWEHGPTADGFNRVGVYEGDHCMEVLQDYLKMEESQQ